MISFLFFENVEQDLFSYKDFSNVTFLVNGTVSPGNMRLQFIVLYSYIFI